MALTFLPVRSRGFRERGRKRWKIKEKEAKKELDVRRGRSHRSFSIRDVGFEEQEKIWTEM